MPKAVAIVQSNYIPWRGYFNLIDAVDEFILFDDMQYTRRDWRNRNLIKTANGLQWLTIPVEVKGKYYQKIAETRISDPGWNQRHWRALVTNYARAKYFDEYSPLFEALYLATNDQYLSQINYQFLTSICALLDIATKLTWSTNYKIVEGKTERLVSLCQQAGATKYISGPAARAYIDEGQFAAAGIELHFFNYDNYPEYPQLFPPFSGGVSVIDLIFNTGPAARQFLKAPDHGPVDRHNPL